MYPRGGRVPYVEFPDQGYDPSGIMQNPGQTNPYPDRGVGPVSVWHQSAFDPTWVAVGAVLRSIWQTPIFDFHPEIRGSGPAYNVALPGTGAQPIWNSAGKMLHVFFGLGANQALLNGLTVTTQEFGSPDDPSNAQSFTAAEDITQTFTPGHGATYISWTPAGGSSYLRFWQVRVVLESTLVAPPQIRIRAGFY